MQRKTTRKNRPQNESNRWKIITVSHFKHDMTDKPRLLSVYDDDNVAIVKARLIGLIG